MGFTEILTIIFVLSKILGFISWSWWLVFLPEIIAIILYIIPIVFLFIAGFVKSIKENSNESLKSKEDG